MPNPTAMASAMRCASPPLKFAHVRSQSSRSMPQASATSSASWWETSGSPDFAPKRLVRADAALNDVELWLCVPKVYIAARKSRGVPGRREASGGTYMTFVRNLGIPVDNSIEHQSSTSNLPSMIKRQTIELRGAVGQS